MAGRGAAESLADHIASLRRYAFALTGSRLEAEDLVQETLTRAIAGIGSFRRSGNLRAWLVAIMHNAFSSAMRRSQLAERRQDRPDSKRRERRSGQQDRQSERA